MKRRKDLFWLTISEVSVYGHLVLLPLICGKADHHEGKHVAEVAAHLMVAGKQRQREGAGVPIFPLRLQPQ